jgi:hypothetical protein
LGGLFSKSSVNTDTGAIGAGGAVMSRTGAAWATVNASPVVAMTVAIATRRFAVTQTPYRPAHCRTRDPLKNRADIPGNVRPKTIELRRTRESRCSVQAG